MVVRVAGLAGAARAIRYNEKKVAKEQARCLHAGNFILDLDQLNINDKIQRFRQQNILNTRSVANTAHISLNFHPQDQLTDKKLVDIAADYMQRAGLENQPYLVYRHFDAGHPHIHLITSSIASDGSRLRQLYPASEQCKLIVKAMEEHHGLTRITDRTQAMVEGSQQAKRIKYGEQSTTKAIAKVLEQVIPNYNFTSLSEFNALLRQYNIQADNGRPGTLMNDRKGLVYHALDDNGKKIGRSIKASSLDSNPGLRRLEARFEQNKLTAAQALDRLTTRVKLTLLGHEGDWRDLADNLKKEGIHAIPYLDAQENPYGFVFIDHALKLVAADHRLAPRLTPDHLLQTLGADRRLAHTLEGRDQRELGRDMNRAIAAQTRNREEEQKLELRQTLTRHI